MAKIVNKSDLSRAEELAQAQLPAAGYKRTEELAQRKDELQQAAEELSNQTQAVKIDPKAFEEDREICNDISKGFMNLDVPGYVVQWINYINARGQAVWEAKARGWVVVNYKMVKNAPAELVKEDGSFRVGDVMAMAIPEQKYKGLVQVDRLRRLKRETGLSSELKDIARSKAARGVFSVQDDVNGSSMDQLATQVLNNMLKKGLIDGLPLK